MTGGVGVPGLQAALPFPSILPGGPVGKLQESSGRGGSRFLMAKIAHFGVQEGPMKPVNEKNPKQTSLSKVGDGFEIGGEEAPTLGDGEQLWAQEKHNVPWALFLASHQP